MYYSILSIQQWPTRKICGENTELLADMRMGIFPLSDKGVKGRGRGKRGGEGEKSTMDMGGWEGRVGHSGYSPIFQLEENSGMGTAIDCVVLFYIVGVGYTLYTIHRITQLSD